MTAIGEAGRTGGVRGTGFDQATAVVARDGGTVYDVTIDEGWAIGEKPHGGYLLATMGRAAIVSGSMAEGLDHDYPVAASAHYVAAPSAGPAEIHAEVLRRGRRMSQVKTRLVQAGTARVEAIFTLGRLTSGAEPWWTDASPPDMTPEGDCDRIPSANPAGMALPIMERVELRLDAGIAGFTQGRPSGAGEVRGWLRFADGRPPDPLALLLAVDVLPPATVDLGVVGWVPTLELTAYVRAVPTAGSLVVRQRARLVEADLFDEVCEVWDSRGRLVAQATQLAAVRLGDARPPGIVPPMS